MTFPRLKRRVQTMFSRVNGETSAFILSRDDHDEPRNIQTMPVLMVQVRLQRRRRRKAQYPPDAQSPRHQAFFADISARDGTQAFSHFIGDGRNNVSLIFDR